MPNSLALSIPCAVALALLARIVVRVLFEHGEFGEQASDLTARIVVAFCATALSVALLLRLFEARGSTTLRPDAAADDSDRRDA